MPNTIIKVDTTIGPEEQDVLHNRWHPDIPMVTTVKPGDEFRVECVDWTGGQISNDDSATDIRDVDLSKVHYLSGPAPCKGHRKATPTADGKRTRHTYQGARPWVIEHQ